MVNAVDLGGSLRGEAGNDQRRRSAQIAGHDRCAAQAFAAFDDGVGAFDGDVGPEARQFAHVHETRFKNALGNDTQARRQGHQHHHLRLGVGRKTGVGQGGHVHRFQAATASHGHGQSLPLDLDTGFAQLVQHRVQMIGTPAFDGDLAVGGSRCDCEGGRFDPVGDDFMLGAVQLLDPVDGDGGAARAHDPGAHPVQEMGEVHHFRLASGAFDGGDAFGQHGGHHHIRGPQHRRPGASAQKDFRADQAGGLRLDVPALDGQLGAQVTHAFQVQVDGPGTNDATAGQGDFGVVLPSQQGAENADRAAHFADEVVVADRLELGRAHGDGVALDRDPGAERGEDFGHEMDITQLRHAPDDAFSGGQQGRRHDRQHRVFRAADLHLAMQRNTAFDQ